VTRRIDLRARSNRPAPTTGWGAVIAIEAQERLFYALAGNIAINNCFNAQAIHAAVTSAPGAMKIPNPNYLTPASFGSLELRKRDHTEFIGQPVDYSDAGMVEVRAITIDGLAFRRLDVIKIDVEGMEIEALAGGAKSIAACRPMMLIEAIKSDPAKLRGWLDSLNYSVHASGLNLLAVHKDDPCFAQIKFVEPNAK
jgi:FkbM family methyltransferase